MAQQAGRVTLALAAEAQVARCPEPPPPMPRESYLLYVLIVACEVGFWFVLLLGLAARYLLRRKTLSRALLVSLPLLDLLLLAFTAIDLRRGTAATFAHGLAAAYIGFTIAFGGLMVKWADAHFAHRFAAGPPPNSAPSRGWELVRYDGKLWGRCVVACLLTMALVEALVQFVGDGDATQPLLAWHKHAFGCIVLWFCFGPAWSLVRSAPVLLSRNAPPSPAAAGRSAGTAADPGVVTWERARSWFASDGALRDIFVRGSGEADWERLLEAVSEWGYQATWSNGGVPIAPPERASAVLAGADPPLLSIQVGPVRVNLHFFAVGEIEMDMDRCEIQSHSAFEQILGFLGRVGQRLQKPVHVAPEGLRDRAFLVYDPSTRSFRLVDA